MPKLSIRDLPVLPTKDIPHGRHPAAAPRCAGSWHCWPHYPARDGLIAFTFLSLLNRLSPYRHPPHTVLIRRARSIGASFRRTLRPVYATGPRTFRSRRALHSVLFARAISSVCLKRSLVSNHILLRCGWKLELLPYIHRRKRGASAKRMIPLAQTARAYIPRSAIMVSN